MQSIAPINSPKEMLAALKDRLRRMEGTRHATDHGPVSSGCAALDRLLPDGGWRRGTLVEWLAEGHGSGAATLAITAAREAAVDGGAVVVMDNHRTFYPVAAVAMGIAWDRLIVVRAGTEADRLWALDQALRCEGVAAVWAPQQKIDPHTFRRLQLAAESSGVLGLLLRDASVRGRPSWSDLQLLVRPQCATGGRRVHVELIRSRCGKSGKAVELEIDDLTGTIRAAPMTGTVPIFA